MSPDRRDPTRQQALVGGHRRSDPTLSTRDCADRLGVSTDFVVGEIRDGRLGGMTIDRPGRRTMYRVSPVELEAYILKFRWKPAKGATA